MTSRAEFTAFVEQTVKDVIQLAEQYTGKTLPRSIGFRWITEPEPIREGIAEVIVNRVYLDEEHIFPCVDIGVGDLRNPLSADRSQSCRTVFLFP
jgi:hypothetical protein